MAMSGAKLAVVTGAWSGIGYELAKIAAEEGYSLLHTRTFQQPGMLAEQHRGMAEPGTGNSKN